MFAECDGQQRQRIIKNVMGYHRVLNNNDFDYSSVCAPVPTWARCVVILMSSEIRCSNKISNWMWRNRFAWNGNPVLRNDTATNWPIVPFSSCADLKQWQSIQWKYYLTYDAMAVFIFNMHWATGSPWWFQITFPYASGRMKCERRQLEIAHWIFIAHFFRADFRLENKFVSSAHQDQCALNNQMIPFEYSGIQFGKGCYAMPNLEFIALSRCHFRSRGPNTQNSFSIYV